MSRAWRRTLQLVVVLLSAVLIKWYYSTASVNELRWILAPTAKMVGLISGKSFAFESYTGYMSSDHTFVIAASCAGMNFLITSFLMLSLRKLWRDRAQKVSWSFLATAPVLAYLATVLANTVRISIALCLRSYHPEIGLSPEQLHRLEGIFVYFGFLMFMFLISERVSCKRAKVSSWIESLGAERRFGLLRRSLFPLLIYYAMTLGIPLANGALRRGSDFVEHGVFVVLTPPLLVVPVMAVQFFLRRQGLSWRQLNADPSARLWIISRFSQLRRRRSLISAQGSALGENGP